MCHSGHAPTFEKKLEYLAMPPLGKVFTTVDIRDLGNPTCQLQGSVYSVWTIAMAQIKKTSNEADSQ